MCTRVAVCLQYGPEIEHLRRQLYTLTVTPYAGLYFAIITVRPQPVITARGMACHDHHSAGNTSGVRLNYDGSIQVLEWPKELGGAPDADVARTCVHRPRLLLITMQPYAA